MHQSLFLLTNMAKLNRIKAVLAEQEKTSKWLAEQVGKSACTVSKWCGNTVQPDLKTLALISKASVFQYFGSKKQIYIYLLEYCKKIIEGIFDKEALNSQTDLFDRILASSRMKMEGLQNQPFILQFITSAWEETSPEVADTLAILTEEASRFRNDLVLREEDALKFKDPEDAQPVFQMLLLMAEGYAARYRGAAAFDFQAVMEDFEKNIAILRKNFYKEEYQK